MEVTVTNMLLSFNVFNTVSHCMSVYLLSFGTQPVCHEAQKEEQGPGGGGGGGVGKVSKRDAMQAIMDLILLLSI